MATVYSFGDFTNHLVLDAYVRAVKPVYLRYYWANFRKFAPSEYADVQSIFQQQKELAVIDSASKAATNVNKMFAAHEGYSHLSPEEWSVLALGLEGLTGDSEASENIRQEVKDIEASDTMESGALLREFFNFSDTLKDKTHTKEEFNEALSSLMESLGGSSELQSAIEQYMLTNPQAVQAMMGSSVFKEIRSNLLSGGTGTLFGIKGISLNAYAAKTRQFLVTLYALAAQTNGAKIDATTKEALEKSLEMYSQNALNDIQGLLGEMSHTYKKIRANELMYSALCKFDESFKESSSDTTSLWHVGNSYVSTTMKFREDKDLRAQLEILAKGANGQVKNTNFTFNSPNVVTYHKVKQKTDSITVDEFGVIDGGVSVKTGRRFSTGKNGVTRIKKIHLQESTPLYTLLTRDFGMKGRSISNLIQLSTAYDPSGETVRMWDNFKELVKVRAALTALLGANNENVPTIMQINDAVVPMPTVISMVASSLYSDDKSAFSSVGLWGYPDIADFQQDRESNWKGSKKNSMKYAVDRSQAQYTDALARLYNAKITIALNNFNYSMFKSYSL